MTCIKANWLAEDRMEINVALHVKVNLCRCDTVNLAARVNLLATEVNHFYTNLRYFK